MPADLIVDGTEFFAQLRYRPRKAGKLICKAEVSPEADPFYRTTQERPPLYDPALPQFAGTLFVRPQRIGKKVRKQPHFAVFHARNVRDHPQRRARIDAADDGVQPHFFKMPAVYLRADPVVADEHHRLFSVRMHDIGKTADALRHETFQQFHIVEERFLRLAEMVVVISFVHEVFQRNFIAELFAEQAEHGGACRHGIPEPIEVLYAVFIVVNIEKVVKERGKPHDGDGGILIQPNL